jgi:chromosome segregation ATPase
MTEESGKEHLTAVEKLERQNEKLRFELRELTAALENAKKRQKNAKIPNLSELNEDQNAVTVNSKIEKLKKEIARMKKELEGNLNIVKITELEDHSKFLSKRIEELQSEHISLKKIEKEQQKAINSATQSNSYPDKIAKLKEDIRVAKERYRELVNEQKANEKIHNEQHKKCVDLEEKCRKMYENIKKKKNEEKKEVDEVTEEKIEDLERKIKEAEKRNSEEENALKKKIKEMELQSREAKHNIELLKIKYKEKDQECRISLLKIKELNKAVKQNQGKPIS